MEALPTVRRAAQIFRRYCYHNRDPLMAGIIVAGWDPKQVGQVYTVPVGGMLIHQPFSIGGSGSTYIYGHVYATYRSNVSKEQCLKFVTNSLAQAMNRDGSSGGVIRLAAIGKDGVERKLF